MKNILVLGSYGYIGSAVFERMSTSYRVEGIDILIDHEDYGSLRPKYIQSFDAVMLFAAISTVEQCKRNAADVFDQNVKRFVDLTQKIRNGQKFIYASSSSVYGTRSFDSRPTEDEAYCNPTFAYDASKLMIDSIVPFLDVEHYGLRLGTVCGASPRMRGTMMNAMIKSALETQKIVVVNPAINRPILSMNDLNTCLVRIVEGDDHRGIYNLASWNSTVGDIAKTIKAYFRKHIGQVSIEEKAGEVGYDFSVDCSKFERTYGFGFSKDPDALIEEIIGCYRTEEKKVADAAEVRASEAI